MDKLDVLLEKLNKLDKVESDINSIKNGIGKIEKTQDIIINELADIKERATDHDVKIQVINSKTKAL